MADRREFLAAISAAGVATITGCTGESNNGGPNDGSSNNKGAEETETNTTTEGTSQREVIVGPDGAFRFKPETLTISAGTTVVFSFESPGHNVTSKPSASDKCKNPQGAKPFASYEGDDHYKVIEQGATYKHTFETMGMFVYVCAPHASQGMVGKITVE